MANFNNNRFLNTINKRRGNWKQGTYTLLHPEKFLGKWPLIYRSSWEERAFYMMDNNENVIKWGSELLEIPYSYSLQSTGNRHKYYVDIYAIIRDKNGIEQKYAIEIKPKCQSVPPVPPKVRNPKAMKNYVYAASTYVKNQNKWKAVETYCKNSNMKFVVLTEEHLF
jgi:hypothetical protein